MPPEAAALAIADFLVMETSITLVTAHAIASAVVSTAISIATNVVIGAMTGAMSQPEAPNLPLEARGRKETVRSTVEPRRVIYGQTRVSGPMLYARTAGATNEFLHLVIALHHGEVAEIGTVWVGDRLSTDARFAAPTHYRQRTDIAIGGAYDAMTFVQLHLGPVGTPLEEGELFQTHNQGSLAATAQALADLINGVSVIGNAVIASVVDGSTLRLDGQFNEYAFWSDISATTGAPTFTTTTTQIQTDPGSLVHVQKYLGTADQAADANLIAESAGQWTADHRLAGIAYLAVRLEFSENAFPSGIQSVSALVKGRKVFDPRNNQTAWSDNFALCVLDYLTGTVPTASGQEPIGVGAALSEVDLDSFIAAANICDETVATAAGGSVRRYTCNGSFQMDANPASILEQMLPCGAAQLVYTGGQYRLYVGAYATPDLTITADWLRGSLQIQPYGSRKDLFNAARGVYVDPDLAYEAVDFAPQAVPAYAEQDGELIYRDLRFSYIQSSASAQRVARLLLERSRRAASLVLPCNYRALACALWQTVTLDIPALPAYQGSVWRVTGWALSDSGGVDLTLQLEEAAAYAWSASQEKAGQAYVVPSIADPSDVAPPTGVAAQSDPLITADGMVIPRLRISWTAAADGLASGYELQYKRSDALFYVSGFPLGRVTVSWVAYLDAGIEYDVRLRTVTIHGTHSDWVEVLGTLAGAGDGADLMVEAGAAGSVYQVAQALDAGAAGSVYAGAQTMDGGPA